MTRDSLNREFELAADFVLHTDRHVFLTGKAGTGKTTFLKYIVEHCSKNAVVAAPTGVAAINAGGVTLHSLFQLPFGPFIPGNKRGFSNQPLNDPHSLLQQVRLNGPKKELIREIELLIIDEVSMLRCDTLDAIDVILRHVRKNTQPFGGLQMLFIGDLYQLPPVIQHEEWDLLSPYYKGPFFFNADVMKRSSPVQIELKKIYRQNEQHFIDLLNRVRNNNLRPIDIQELNKRYRGVQSLDIFENAITLTTHNKKADTINRGNLEKLAAPVYRFEAAIEKEFNENAYPTDKVLLLKEGAQVMFIKNDSGESRRYYNGKLATISSISNEEIVVLPIGSTDPIKLDKETWKNIRYSYNAEEESVEEEELGSFTQYPIRLAWAITIHKSQGLTFEKAVIDAGQSFASGQVYVALSRCTSLEGVVLLSQIQRDSIIANPEVKWFEEQQRDTDTLGAALEQDKVVFQIHQLLRLFDWKPLLKSARELKEFVAKKELVSKAGEIEFVQDCLQKLVAQMDVADKFILKMTNWVHPEMLQQESHAVGETLNRAFPWFTKALHDELVLPLQEKKILLGKRSRVTQYYRALIDFENEVWKKLNQLQRARFPAMNYSGSGQNYKRLADAGFEAEKPAKKEKGGSITETLNLFNSGSSPNAIAEIRGLSVSTIWGHLSTAVLQRRIAVTELLDEKTIISIERVLIDLGDQCTASSCKAVLGDAFDYEQIRVVMNHRKQKALSAND